MRSLIAVASVVISVAVLPSCGSNPPTTPSQPSTVRVSGPSSIAPGTSAQLYAYFNTSPIDVSATAQWHSSDTSILTVSTTGLASAIQSGDVTVTATYSAVNGSQAIIVVPASTFRLSGSVQGFGVPLMGASVQVTAGVGTGLSTSTDSSGNYKLYGVAGAIQLTVSKDLYGTSTQAVTVTSNTNHLDFSLAPVNTPQSVAGTYTLIITADPACPTTGAGVLPGVGHQRQYTATITQKEGQLEVVLSGAHLVPDDNSFSGTVAADGGMTFGLHDFYYYDGPGFAELLDGLGEVYGLVGLIAATRSGNDLVGIFNGAIQVTAGSPFGSIVGQCTSAHHSITFTNLSTSPARVRIRR